jgi:GT2 family glycosyltransferase
MPYRGDDEIFEVEAVSGSCMIIRRQVIDQIGYLDETYFAYQEDTDFCFRARKAGWKIFYYPRGAITHFGGEGGSAFQPYQGIYQWHRSYFIYYNRNLAKEYSVLVNGVMYAGMLFKLLISLLTNLVSKKKTVGTKKPR